MTARALWLTLSVSAVMAVATPVLAQGYSRPPAPRLDEEFMVRTRPLEAGGRGAAGVNCQMLQVDAGEAFYVASTSPDWAVTIEAINGAMCNFDDDRDLPEGWRLMATSPEPGGAAVLTVTVPGYYSVRVSAPDLPRGETLYIMTTPRQAETAE